MSSVGWGRSIATRGSPATRAEAALQSMEPCFLGSSVPGDGMLCIGGGLINSKMELNL